MSRTVAIGRAMNGAEMFMNRSLAKATPIAPWSDFLGFRW
jgi:hypothetical protein